MDAKLALKDKGWWYDIREHRPAVAVWFFLHLLDFGLAKVASSYGINISSGYFTYGYEWNWFLRELSTPAFALVKVCLTMVAVIWLAIWKWLWFLKWLNIAFAILVIWNIVDLVKIVL